MASRAHAATPAEVAAAVQAARAAYGTWGRMDFRRRTALLRAVADEIGSRHMALAAVASLETGKTRTESIIEVQEAIDLVNAYAGHVEENAGYTRPASSRSWRASATRRAAPVRRVRRHLRRSTSRSRSPPARSAAALVAGNTVVFKPAETTPWSGVLLAEILHEAGLPGGRAEPRHGGADVGQALVADAGVDGIAFTGSYDVGREIYRALAAGEPTRGRARRDGRQEPGLRHRAAPTSTRRRTASRARLSAPSGQKCSAVLARAVSTRASTTRSSSGSPTRASWSSATPPAGRLFIGPGHQRRGRASASSAAVADAAPRRPIVAGGERLAGGTFRRGYFVAADDRRRPARGHRLNRDELFLPFISRRCASTDLDDGDRRRQPQSPSA